MTMYIRTGLSRKDVATLLSVDIGHTAVREVTPELLRYSETREGMTAVWGDDPRVMSQPPNVLLADPQEVRDLLAWLWTYVPDFRPLTAIVRLLDRDSFKVALSLAAKPSLGRITNSWLGLIFAETASLTNLKETARPSYSACLCSASFAQARGKAVGYEADAITRLATTWAQAQSLVGQNNLPRLTHELGRVWIHLHALDSERGITGKDSIFDAVDRSIGSALIEYRETGGLGTDAWYRLTENRAFARDARTLVDTSREERVRKFQTITTELIRSQAKDERDSFMIAYLASQVSPGSMDHIHLLAMAPSELRSSYYWYGVLAGLPRSSTLPASFYGMGRKLLRDLMRRETVFDRPTVDVDHAEIQVATESTRSEILRGAYPGFLNVGLLPGVSTLLRFRESDRISAPDEFSSKELADIMRRLERALAESQFLYERLSKGFGFSQQQSLSYNRNSKKK